MPVVRGKCEWACLHAPNTRYKPVYSINIIVDTEQEDRVMKDLHQVDPKAKDPFVNGKNGERILKLKTNFINSITGEDVPPFPVTDKNGQPITDLVGNGSVVDVQYTFKTWNNKDGTGMGKYLNKVRVLDMVPYTDDFDSQPDYVPESGDKVVAAEDDEF